MNDKHKQIIAMLNEAGRKRRAVPADRCPDEIALSVYIEELRKGIPLQQKLNAIEKHVNECDACFQVVAHALNAINLHHLLKPNPKFNLSNFTVNWMNTLNTAYSNQSQTFDLYRSNLSFISEFPGEAKTAQFNNINVSLVPKWLKNKFVLEISLSNIDDDKPLSQVHVALINQNGLTLASLITNKRGKGQFKEIPDGEYSLVIDG